VWSKPVREKHAAFRACYDGLRNTTPAARGTVAARFQVGADGRASEVCIVSSAIADNTFLRCIAETYRTVEWPAGYADDACGPPTIVYPLRFERGE
jgi:hypothetical protein